ncbi:hypothetical protein A7W90_16025 [Clostridium sp. Bc-iso-3]|nr:hypothetical protein A7W90_16025 [Clostridium sp. Bc-iso-3]
MSINERQNSELNLKRLAAQRQLYSDAKKMMYIQFAISGMAVIVFAIIGNIISKEYAVYITVLSILCVLFDELFLTKRIENLRLNAAIIQEDFDCDVLQIPFNYIKNSHGTMLETIQENSKKYLSKNKNFDLLVNWYPGMDMADLKYGRIICQSTNCWWNQKLREKYSNFLILSTATIFIFLLLIALFNGITLSGFIMSVISPILPGGVLVYKIDRDNKKAIQNLNDMKNKLDSIIERLRAKELYPDEKLQNDIRCLQDMIFENRSASPLIPDRFYFRYRDRYEDIAQTSNKELVELIKTQYNE